MKNHYETGTIIKKTDNQTFTIKFDEKNKIFTNAAKARGLSEEEVIKRILDSAQINIQNHLRKA